MNVQIVAIEFIGLLVLDYMNNNNEVMKNTSLDKFLSVSIIIPTYNEEKNIIYVLKKIPNISNICEIILIDGRSVDNTIDFALSINQDIKVLYQDGKGKGNAVLCGVNNAQGEYFLILDADGSQRPDEIFNFVNCAKKGYDLVKGSRYMNGGSTLDDTYFRRFLIFLAQNFANILWGTNYTDIGYGMLLINRQKFLDLKIESQGFQMEWELMAKAKMHNLKVIEIPCFEELRRYGNSNLSYIRDGYKIAKIVFKYSYIMLFKKYKSTGV